MFPVPRISSQFEQEWSEELATYLRCPLEAFRSNPTMHMDYPQEVVKVELMDGSFVQFNHAFAIVSAAKKTIAIFTEHCGHHVFPYHEARVFRNGELHWHDT